MTFAVSKAGLRAKGDIIMKKFYVCCVALGMLCFGFTFAGADTIIDTYWGGTVQHASATAYGDVIGDPYFNVDSMTVTRSGSAWNVAIAGAYFGNSLNPAVDSGYPNLLGPGDLYINSTGWIATQGPAGHYETDTFNGSEGWNYVVTKVNGNWGLYKLESTITNTTVSPQLNPNNYIFRYDQAWKGGAGAYIGAATYDLSSTGLIITFDTDKEVFADDVGFHWTMQCGNDVIEGTAHVPVPEPGTMILLGSGLIGLAGYARKRFRK